MTESARAGRLVIVCGVPGVGKTTLAERIEAAYGAVRFCPDEWMEALGIDLFDQEMRGRIERFQWQLVQRLLQLRQPAAVEWGTWGREERGKQVG